MAKCVHCKSETHLYNSGVPICFVCARVNPRLNLIGKHYRLIRESIALHFEGDKRLTTMIPADSTIKVVSGPTDGSGLIDVLRDGEVVSMFQQDLLARAVEIEKKATRA